VAAVNYGCGDNPDVVTVVAPVSITNIVVGGPMFGLGELTD